MNGRRNGRPQLASPSHHKAGNSPSIALTTAEAWEMIRVAHTGILTTLRLDGSPIAVPVWHVCFDNLVFVGAPAATKKIDRITNDPRVSFLVEAGINWTHLRAVHLDARAAIIDDQALADRVAEALADKYRHARTDDS